MLSRAATDTNVKEFGDNYKQILYIYQRGCDPTDRFNPLPHFCACPKPGPGFQTFNVVVFFSVHWVQLWWEVIVCFVDIGGSDDHHCLNFLFIIFQIKSFFSSHSTIDCIFMLTAFYIMTIMLMSYISLYMNFT